MVESRWASELSALRTSQRREYRDCVMKLHEDSHFSANTASPAYRSDVSHITSTTSAPLVGLTCLISPPLVEKETRGRQHLATPLKTCQYIEAGFLTGWLLCLSPNSDVTASETPPFPHLGCVPAVVPIKGGSSA